MTDERKRSAQDPGDPTRAPAVSDADHSEQPGKLRDAKHPEEKPDTTTVAQVQELPD